MSVTQLTLQVQHKWCFEGTNPSVEVIVKGYLYHDSLTFQSFHNLTPLCIFRTQINVVLMRSESWLSHRHQGNTLLKRRLSSDSTILWSDEKRLNSIISSHPRKVIVFVLLHTKSIHDATLNECWTTWTIFTMSFALWIFFCLWGESECSQTLSKLNLGSNPFFWWSVPLI